jgi:hypothetical protein
MAVWEAELILSVRLWMDGPDGQAEVWRGFAQCFGTSQGRTELRQFETLLTCLCTNARRPLVRHGRGCMCVGSDEAILRTLVHEAARGDLAEASCIASLLVPACHAEPIALMAAQVGQTMQQMARRTPVEEHPGDTPAQRVLH